MGSQFFQLILVGRIPIGKIRRQLAPRQAFKPGSQLGRTHGIAAESEEIGFPVQFFSRGPLKDVIPDIPEAGGEVLGRIAKGHGRPGRRIIDDDLAFRIFAERKTPCQFVPHNFPAGG